MMKNIKQKYFDEKYITVGTVVDVHSVIEIKKSDIPLVNMPYPKNFPVSRRDFVRIKLEKEIRGQIVGACKRQSGKTVYYAHSDYYGEEIKEGKDFIPEETRVLYLVRTGWLNKPIMVDINCIRIMYSEGRLYDLPLLARLPEKIKETANV